MIIVIKTKYFLIAFEVLLSIRTIEQRATIDVYRLLYFIDTRIVIMPDINTTTYIIIIYQREARGRRPAAIILYVLVILNYNRIGPEVR